MQLGRRHKLLDPVEPEGVAEKGVLEFALENAFLLFFHAPTAFKGEAHYPFQVVVRDGLVRVGMEKLDQTTYGLAGGLDVAAGKCAAEMDASIENIRAGGETEPRPGFGEEVRDKAEMIGEMFSRIKLRVIPARR